MNKLALIFALFIGLVSTSFAQTPELKSYILEVDVKEGLNSVVLPNGKGTLRFISRGDNLSNFTIVDKTGKAIKLAPKGDGSETSGSLNCPCQETCYEDEIGKACVCFCSTCTSGGGGSGLTPKNKRFVVLQSS